LALAGTQSFFQPAAQLFDLLTLPLDLRFLTFQVLQHTLPLLQRRQMIGGPWDGGFHSPIMHRALFPQLPVSRAVSPFSQCRSRHWLGR